MQEARVARQRGRQTDERCRPPVFRMPRPRAPAWYTARHRTHVVQQQIAEQPCRRAVLGGQQRAMAGCAAAGGEKTLRLSHHAAPTATSAPTANVKCRKVGNNAIQHLRGGISHRRLAAMRSAAASGLGQACSRPRARDDVRSRGRDRDRTLRPSAPPECGLRRLSSRIDRPLRGHRRAQPGAPDRARCPPVRPRSTSSAVSGTRSIAPRPRRSGATPEATCRLPGRAGRWRGRSGTGNACPPAHPPHNVVSCAPSNPSGRRPGTASICIRRPYTGIGRPIRPSQEQHDATAFNGVVSTHRDRGTSCSAMARSAGARVEQWPQAVHPPASMPVAGTQFRPNSLRPICRSSPSNTPPPWRSSLRT